MGRLIIWAYDDPRDVKIANIRFETAPTLLLGRGAAVGYGVVLLVVGVVRLVSRSRRSLTQRQWANASSDFRV
jgi:hypothetical protein